MQVDACDTFREPCRAGWGEIEPTRRRSEQGRNKEVGEPARSPATLLPEPHITARTFAPSEYVTTQMKSSSPSEEMKVLVACLAMSRRQKPRLTLSPSSFLTSAAVHMLPETSTTKQ